VLAGFPGPGSPRSHVLPYRLLKLGLNIGQGAGLWFDCNYVFSDMFRFANELDQVAQREAVFVPVHNLLVHFALTSKLWISYV
jgi:hypothetical protein